MALPVQHNRPWPVQEPRDLAVPQGMRGESFRAMGTTVTLLLPAHAAAVGLMVARNLFNTWEAALSRFQPHSELSTLNRQAGATADVSRLLLDVVATALEAARATGGLFDPTMLNQIVDAGYDRSFEQIVEAGPAAGTPPMPGGGWRQVRLDRERRQISVPVGIGIDLGGIAKGMAVDAVIARFRALGISTALVNAGGDLAVIGTPLETNSWSIAVPGRDRAWTIPLRLGALATSSRSRRHWRQGEVERHHLLDPRTGASAAPTLWSVTAVAGSCAQAEVAAKVAFVLGPEAGAAYIEQQDFAGLLVEDGGDMHAAGSWPVTRMHEHAGGAA